LNRIKEKKKKGSSLGRAIYDSISFDTHDISLGEHSTAKHREKRASFFFFPLFPSVRNRVRRVCVLVQALGPSIYSCLRYIYIIFFFFFFFPSAFSKGGMKKKKE
jgi:hypothetical protein